MNFSSKLFLVSIKTPIVALLLITLVFSSLAYIILYCEIGVYEKYDGIILDSRGELLFKINWSENISDLHKGASAIWYFSDNDKRYNGQILDLNKQDNFIIIKNTSKTELKNIKVSEKKVFIELLVGKTKIYKRLFQKNTFS